MRIRQVKPDYWRDERLSSLTDTDRLVYIGLWMEADDAGWFKENVTEIASDLFPYQGRQARERKVAATLDRLRALGRVVSHPCGHSLVPRMEAHQRFSSPEKRVFTIAKQHQACIPAGTRGSPRFPDTEMELVGNEEMELLGYPSLRDSGETRPRIVSGGTR